MSVTVQRLPGDREGDDIVSAVLTTADSQLERGTYEVNTEDRDRRTVSGAILPTEFLQPGGMHGVDVMGEVKNGLLTNYSYSAVSSTSGVSVSTQVELETIK